MKGGYREWPWNITSHLIHLICSNYVLLFELPNYSITSSFWEWHEEIRHVQGFFMLLCESIARTVLYNQATWTFCQTGMSQKHIGHMGFNDLQSTRIILDFWNLAQIQINSNLQEVGWFSNPKRCVPKKDHWVCAVDRADVFSEGPLAGRVDVRFAWWW